MNQEVYADAVANAETARTVQNYPAALEWIRKALEENPNDLNALTKAGMICMPLGELEQSEEYFRKAQELEPENGDYLFRRANVCFLQGDFGKAMELYAEAEIKGCSEEILPKLYYQMALICSIRQDVAAALVNFQKYENTEKSKLAALNPDVISEKLKLYMLAEDYQNAAKCAAQWIAMSPSELSCYMAYFNILMIQNDYQNAAKALTDAETYAEHDEAGYLEIQMEKINLYMTVAEVADAQNRAAYLQQAGELVRTLLQYPQADRKELTLKYAEICMKMQRYDEAITTAVPLLSGQKVPVASEVPVHTQEMTPEETEAMLDADIDMMETKIRTQELSDSLGTEVYYDSDGNPVRNFPDGAFDSLNTELQNVSGTPELSAPEPEKTDIAFTDRLYYTLLSCYAAKEAYAECAFIAGSLKHSQNTEYSDFARYMEVFSAKHLPAQFTPEQAEQKYAEAMAFFRNRMLHGENRYPAILFRSRLYAEAGKFAKAEEMAGLLNAEDKAAMLQYIADCRKTIR